MSYSKNIFFYTLAVSALLFTSGTGYAANEYVPYPASTSPAPTMQVNDTTMNVTSSNPSVTTYAPAPAPSTAPAPAPEIYPSANAPTSNTYSGNTQLYHRTQQAQQPTTFDQLPSYRYDSSLDPRNDPTPAPPPRPKQKKENPYYPYLTLETRSGLELGGSIAYYKYEEPDFPSTPVIDVKSNGEWSGINAKGTLQLGDGFFAQLDGRYAFGWLDYSGSGEASGEFTDSVEARALVGLDFILKEYAFSPYLGFGYRTLYNDARGVSTTGASGYRRYNQLYYLPIGFYQRTHIDSNSRLTSMTEFDAVLHGNQTSYLSDVDSGLPDVSNGQTSGFGIRGDIMYERRKWAIGPYFTYWQLDNSKPSLFTGTSASACAPDSAPCVFSGTEPHNYTIEAGVKVHYHFW